MIDVSDMIKVTKIVDPHAKPPPPRPPPAPAPPPPPEEPHSDQPSTSSSACAAPTEKAVETHRDDTDEASVTKAVVVRLFADLTSKVPDWTAFCKAIPLLPSRAAQKEDYETLIELRNNQARFLDYLSTTKAKYFDNATEYDFSAIKRVLLRESHKLSFLECRQEMYSSVMAQVQQVAFNEIRLANDHTSNNNTKVKRTRLTFKQAGMLVDKVSLDHIAMDNKLIVDISQFHDWNYGDRCYLILDVFQSGTMEVEKTKF